MTDRPAGAARKLRLAELDRSLEQRPDATEALFERAGLLREDGRFEEAKRDYLELLRRFPTDFGALNDFGALVLNAGYKSAARSLFGEAVRHHPNDARGHINLANLLLHMGEYPIAREHFETALRIAPDNHHAHSGLSNLLTALGDAAGARKHRDLAFTENFQTGLPFRGEGTPIAVLLLVSAAGGNIPTRAILDDRQFQTTVLMAEYVPSDFALPRHDLIFNSIGDADLCAEGLAAAGAIIARSDRPVINHPGGVRETGRAANVRRLGRLPNVVVPRMTIMPRQALAGPQGASLAARHGFNFPFLIRAPGFHTGEHFVRIEDQRELAAAAAASPGENLYLIEQLDARDGDGFFRKMRVMIIDRKIYPLHLAISRHWTVHYFRADMAESAENRSQDAAFLADMAGVIGARAMAALGRINTALDLDYCGVDFAVNRNGDVLFFEANATMVMVPLSEDPKWDYRRPAFDRAFAAIRAMLLQRSGRN